EADEFCKKLNDLDKKKPAGWMYRLPTEAEWEYSCRGGASSYQVFHFGNKLSFREANFNANFPYGGAPKGERVFRTCKAGNYSKKNGFGLYDMHGNVCEWCLDWYDKDYYAKGPPRDPPGPAGPRKERVLRGGDWNVFAAQCRSAYRDAGAPGDRSFK